MLQPLDADLTAIAALVTTGFGRGLLTLADAAALRSSAGLGSAALSNTGDFDAAGAAAAAQAAAQPLDADLTAIAALATTSYGRSLLTAANAAALRTLAGTVIGTDVQAHDADLDAIAALATTAYGRSLLEAANAAGLRTLAGLVPGTDVQAFDADLASIAALTTTSYGRSVLEAASAAALRTLAGLTALAIAAVDDATVELNAGVLRVKADGITANEIAANAVGSSEIAADAVGTSELADNAVDTGAIAAAAVTSTKIAADSVKPSHLEDGLVRPGELGYVGWSGNPDTVPTAIAPVTRTPYLMKMWVPENLTITDLTVIVGGTAGSGLTAGGNRLGVFSSAGTLLSQSADITAWTVNVPITAVLAAAQAITGGAGVFVWLALLVTASTLPTIARHASGGLTSPVLVNGKLTGANLRCGTLAQVTAGNPLPSSFTPSSGLTASNVPFYMAAA